MLMTYEAEPAILDVGYRLINDDKTVDTALTSVGVTEIEPGCYGVDLADDKAGKTIQWFEGAVYAVSERIPVLDVTVNPPAVDMTPVTAAIGAIDMLTLPEIEASTIIAKTTDVTDGVQALLDRIELLNDVDLTDVPGAVWAHLQRSLTDPVDAVVDHAAIAAAVVADIALFMTIADTIHMGRGLGEIEVVDTISDGSKGIKGVTVRAFLKSNGLVDWSSIKGRDTTDSTGEYTLFLDPGDYVLSVEKAGVQITTINKTVDPIA